MPGFDPVVRGGTAATAAGMFRTDIGGRRIAAFATSLFQHIADDTAPWRRARTRLAVAAVACGRGGCVRRDRPQAGPVHEKREE